MRQHTPDIDRDHYRDIDALHKLVEESSLLPRGSKEWKALVARQDELMHKIWHWGRTTEPAAD